MHALLNRFWLWEDFLLSPKESKFHYLKNYTILFDYERFFSRKVSIKIANLESNAAKCACKSHFETRILDSSKSLHFKVVKSLLGLTTTCFLAIKLQLQFGNPKQRFLIRLSVFLLSNKTAIGMGHDSYRSIVYPGIRLSVFHSSDILCTYLAISKSCFISV